MTPRTSAWRAESAIPQRGLIWPAFSKAELFNPRRQVWKRHFRWQRGRVIGKTLAGKVTVQVLNMNELGRVLVRQSLHNEGRFPPED